MFSVDRGAPAIFFGGFGCPIILLMVNKNPRTGLVRGFSVLEVVMD